MKFIESKPAAVFCCFRFLVFSKQNIVKTSVSINGQLLCQSAKRISTTLFVCPWKANQYSTGLHRITVDVQDADAASATASMLFSLDGSMPLLDLIPAIVMLADFCVIAKIIYFAVFLVVVMLPLLLRCINLQSPCGLFCPRQFIAFINEDHLFWPVFYYSLLLCIGPMFIGELVAGSIGFCFVHGILTNGHWIPGSLTYLYGAFHIISFNIPLMFSLGDMSLRRKNATRNEHAAAQRMRSVVTYLPFALQLSCRIYVALNIRACYGWMAFLLCPVATWTIPFSAWIMQRNRTRN